LKFFRAIGEGIKAPQPEGPENVVVVQFGFGSVSFTPWL